MINIPANFTNALLNGGQFLDLKPLLSAVGVALPDSIQSLGFNMGGLLSAGISPVAPTGNDPLATVMFDGLAFTAECGEAEAQADLRARWPGAVFVEDPDRVLPLVSAAFGGRGADLHLIGAPFQIKVWEALLQIPSGHVTTYSDIARVIGAPKAVRAVGTAVGRNPISWLIPCHRALRKSGGLGGYHWGLPVKRAMLAWESARQDASPQQE